MINNVYVGQNALLLLIYCIQCFEALKILQSVCNLQPQE